MGLHVAEARALHDLLELDLREGHPHLRSHSLDALARLFLHLAKAHDQHVRPLAPGPEARGVHGPAVGQGVQRELQPLIDPDEEDAESKERNADARVWFKGLQAIRDKVGIKSIYDLSATPYYLKGSGYNEGVTPSSSKARLWFGVGLVMTSKTWAGPSWSRFPH